MAVKNFRKLPSSAEEGKADAVAAAGVVLVNKNHSVDQHHAVCAINGASRLLITGAATPPRLRRGVCSRYNLPMRLAFAALKFILTERLAPKARRPSSKTTATTIRT